MQRRQRLSANVPLGRCRGLLLCCSGLIVLCAGFIRSSRWPSSSGAFPSEYYGTWTLVEMSGGIAGRTQTFPPGQRVVELLQSSPPSKYTILVVVNDSPPAEREVRYETQTIFGTPGWMILQGSSGGIDQLVRYSPPPADSLSLVDNVYDGFSYKYQRVEE